MEQALLRKIPISELGQYIKSSRNLIFSGSALSIKPKNSVVIFDFSSTEATSCKINFRRDSGNGLLLSHCAGKNKEHQIVSKSAQELILPIGKNKELQLHRTNRSSGIISISDISLYGENVKVDWNSLLKKCDDYGCLRLVGTDLLASEGGFIKGSGVTVQTDPAGMFTRDGDLIKFVGSCRVSSLSVNRPANNEPVFRNVIFDTNKDKFSQDFCNSHAKEEDGCVIIDRRGSVSVPFSLAIPENHYRVTVFASKIDGNGKMVFGLLPDAGGSAYTVLGPEIKASSLNIKPSAGISSVSVWRHSSSKGRIKVNRIVIEKIGNDIAPVLSRDIRHITLTGAEPDQPVPILASQSIISEPITAVTTSISTDVVDKVEAVSRQFAMFQPSPVQVGATDVSGSVSVKGHKARLWLSRLQSMYPNIKDRKSGNLTICDVHNIVPAQKVWLEEFTGDRLDTISALKQAKVIYTPSLKNKILLSHAFPNVSIEVAHLPLPKIHSRKNTEDYFLYVENNKEDTKHLLSILDSKRLCIVGTRQPIPRGARYISEYDLYTNLSLALSRAKGLIDFTVNTHFRSGLVDLAIGMGIPVITNNHYYIGKAIVVRNTRTEKVSKKALSDGLGKLSFKQEDPKYNYDVLEALKHLGVL